MLKKRHVHSPRGRLQTFSSVRSAYTTPDWPLLASRNFESGGRLRAVLCCVVLPSTRKRAAVRPPREYYLSYADRSALYATRPGRRALRCLANDVHHRHVHASCPSRALGYNYSLGPLPPAVGDLSRFCLQKPSSIDLDHEDYQPTLVSIRCGQVRRGCPIQPQEYG